MKTILKKLLEKQVLTQQELEQLEESEEVLCFETLGDSGYYVGLTWFDITLKNNNRYDVYCKY